jgi:hypothetical protein
MPGMKCPFSTVQAAGLAQCSLAQQVVRRGGSEYDCTETASFDRCSAVAGKLLTIGLPALGYEDDLTQTPKSAYDRVLLGGLAGIDAILAAADPATADLGPRIAAFSERFPEPAAVPAEPLVEAIRNYSPPKRRGRRG